LDQLGSLVAVSFDQRSTSATSSRASTVCQSCGHATFPTDHPALRLAAARAYCPVFARPQLDFRNLIGAPGASASVCLAAKHALDDSVDMRVSRSKPLVQLPAGAEFAGSFQQSVATRELRARLSPKVAAQRRQFVRQYAPGCSPAEMGQAQQMIPAGTNEIET